MADKDATEVIYSFLSGLKENDTVKIQNLIDAMEDHIIKSFFDADRKIDYKAVWLKRIQTCTSNRNLRLDNKSPTWKAIDDKIRLRLTTPPAPTRLTPAASSPSSRSSSSASSSCASLKTKLSDTDRDKVLKAYDDLDPETCWYLEATKRRARFEKKLPWSVESRMREFVATLSYVHPSLSFIFDTNDLNWASYFDEEELCELRSFGDPVLRRIPAELKSHFNQIENLETALDAYNYGRTIEHHPIAQPLLAWLSQTLMQTSKFFIPGACTPLKNFLESDRLYYLWSLINTIHHNSDIEALGKEKTSTSNAASLNSKRKLSAVEEIEREKIGRRMDTIYIGGEIELGALEAGCQKDNTKEFEDSMLKLPFVLKDMLTEIVDCRPSLLHKAHVVGYNVNGNSIRLIDADIPKGHIIRLRRTEQLKYPVNSNDYVFKMLSLLELAVYGKVIIEDTYKLCCETRVRPLIAGGPSLIPSSFIPTAYNQDSLSSTSSNSTKRSRQKINSA